MSSLADKGTPLKRRLEKLKPMITYGQMTQFVALIVQGVILLTRDCYTPRIQPFYLVGCSCLGLYRRSDVANAYSPAKQALQCTIFLILFANFAIRNYFKKPAEARGKKIQ